MAQCPGFRDRAGAPGKEGQAAHLLRRWRWRQALAGWAGVPAPAPLHCPAPWLLPRPLVLASDLARHCNSAAGREWSKVKQRERRSVPSSAQLSGSIPASTAGPLHPATVALVGVAILLKRCSDDLGLVGVLMTSMAPHNHMQPTIRTNQPCFLSARAELAQFPPAEKGF